MIRLAHLVTHPIQYFAPLYRSLSGLPGIQLSVLFASRHGLAPSFDQGFGRTIQFDVPLLEGYSHEFLPNLGSGEPTGSFGNFDSPDVANLLASRGVDVLWIHGWGYRVQWQAIRAARRLRIPYLIRGETNLLLKPRFSPRWFVSRFRLGGMLRSAAGCLYIGRSNRAFYSSMGVQDNRLFPAHYSVDAEAFRLASADSEFRIQLRDRFQVPPDGFVVVCSAKAIARKRLHDAIQATGRTPPCVQLWILGDGPLRPELERFAATVAPGRVRWHGFINQSQLPGLLGAADVFLMPSEEEPWGLAVNEAMACGLPVISTTGVGCAPDLIEPGKTGYLYPVGDVGALVECLERLVADRAQCRRLGQAAQTHVLSGYDCKCTASQIASAVQQVVESSNGTRRV